MAKAASATAKATNDTLRATLEPQERAFKFQEVEILALLMNDRARTNLTATTGGSRAVHARLEALGIIGDGALSETGDN
jgi:hypothetical protein